MDEIANKKIEEFFGRYRLQNYGPEKILLYPGDEPEDIIHLVSGHLRQYDISNQGDKVVVNVFKTPAYIPMSWAINRTVNQYYYETVDDVTLRRAPVDSVVDFVKKNPEVSFDLLRRIYLGTDVVLRRMAHAMGGTAHTRIIYELLLEAKRFGIKQKDGSILVSMPVYQLAARTGLTRETASRELSKLKSLGIENNKGIKIKDLKVLEDKLDGNL